MPKKLRLGIGHQCTVNINYLQPVKLMSEIYPNKTAHTIVDNLLVIKQDTRLVNRCQQSVVIFLPDDFNTSEVYCMKCWAKVTNKGSEENLFERNETAADTEGAGEDTE